MLITARPEDIGNKEEHYYGEITKTGELSMKLVKWKAPKGKKEKGNNSYTTSILAENFERFRLFKITATPCDTCHEDLVKDKKLIHIDSSMQVEQELMSAIEVRVNVFNPNTVKIRAPRELVHLDDEYFIGCDSGFPLKWKKKRRKYYYSKLPVAFLALENITRKREFCKFNSEPTDCGKAFAELLPVGGPLPLTLYAEAGYYYRLFEFNPYAGISLIKQYEKGKSNLLLSVERSSAEKNLNLSGTIGYQYPFFTIPLNKSNPFSLWQKPGEPTYKCLRMYVGTELKFTKTPTNRNNLEQNIHVGLAAVNRKEKSIFRYLFIQYGVTTDYLDHREADIYSITELGINLKLKSFGLKE